MSEKTVVRTREKWVDDVKVIACILVVLGHFTAIDLIRKSKHKVLATVCIPAACSYILSGVKHSN